MRVNGSPHVAPRRRNRYTPDAFIGSTDLTPYGPPLPGWVQPQALFGLLHSRYLLLLMLILVSASSLDARVILSVSTCAVVTARGLPFFARVGFALFSAAFAQLLVVHDIPALASLASISVSLVLIFFWLFWDAHYSNNVWRLSTFVPQVALPLFALVMGTSAGIPFGELSHSIASSVCTYLLLVGLVFLAIGENLNVHLLAPSLIAFLTFAGLGMYIPAAFLAAFVAGAVVCEFEKTKLRLWKIITPDAVITVASAHPPAHFAGEVVLPGPTGHGCSLRESATDLFSTLFVIGSASVVAIYGGLYVAGAYAVTLLTLESTWSWMSSFTLTSKILAFFLRSRHARFWFPTIIENRLELPEAFTVLARVAAKVVKIWRMARDPIALAAEATDVALELGVHQTIVDLVSKTVSTIRSQASKHTSPAASPLLSSETPSQSSHSTPAPTPPSTPSRVDSSAFPSRDSDYAVDKGTGTSRAAQITLLVGVLAIIVAGVMHVGASAMADYQPPKTIHELASGINDLATLKQKGIPLIQAIVNSVGRHVLGKDVDYFPSSHAALAERYRSINQTLLNLSRTDPAVPWSPVEIETFERIESQVNTLREDVVSCPDPCHNLTAGITQLQRSLDFYRTRVPRKAPQRVVPTTFYAFGAAGKGKSWLIKAMIDRLKQRDHTLTDVVMSSDQIAHFADSYNGESIIHVTEAFANKGQEDLSSQADWILKVINDVSAPVEKADLADKGRVFYIPQYLFIDTNLAPDSFIELATNAGIDGPALLRRLHFCATLTKDRSGSIASLDLDTEYSDLTLWRTEPPSKGVLGGWTAIKRPFSLLYRDFCAHHDVNRGQKSFSDISYLSSMSNTPFDSVGPKIERSILAGYKKPLPKPKFVRVPHTDPVPGHTVDQPPALITEEEVELVPKPSGPPPSTAPSLLIVAPADLPVDKGHGTMLKAESSNPRKKEDPVSTHIVDATPIPKWLPNDFSNDYVSNWLISPGPIHSFAKTFEVPLFHTKIVDFMRSADPVARKRVGLEAIKLPIWSDQQRTGIIAAISAPFHAPQWKQEAIPETLYIPPNYPRPLVQRWAANVVHVLWPSSPSEKDMRCNPVLRSLLEDFPNDKVAIAKLAKEYMWKFNYSLMALPTQCGNWIRLQLTQSSFDDSVRRAEATLFSIRTKSIILYSVLTTIGLFAAGGLLWAVLRTSVEQDEGEGMSGRSDKTTTHNDPPRAAVAGRPGRPAMKAILPTAPGKGAFSTTSVALRDDTVAEQVSDKAEANNSVGVEYPTEPGGPIQKDWGVCSGRLVFTVSHGPKPYGPITFVRDGRHFTYNLADLPHILGHQNRTTAPSGRVAIVDINAYLLPGTFPATPNIDNKFITDSELPAMKYCSFASRHSGGDRVAGAFAPVLCDLDLADGTNVTVVDQIGFMAKIFRGDCGKLASLRNPQLPHKLVGILHATSNTRQISFIQAITQEFIKQVRDELLSSSPLQEDALVEPLDTEAIDLDSGTGTFLWHRHKLPIPAQFRPTGRVPEPYRTSTYSKSKLHPGPLCTWSCPKRHESPVVCYHLLCPAAEGQTSPALAHPLYSERLSRHYDPVYESLVKADFQPPPLSMVVDGRTLEDTIRELAPPFYRAFLPPPIAGAPERLTLHQAINGVRREDGTEVVKPLELTTSPGAFHVNATYYVDGLSTKPLRGKLKVLRCLKHGHASKCPAGIRCEYELIPEVQRLYDNLLAKVKRGEPIVVVYHRYNKDEEREMGKSVRSLIVGPVEYNLLCRVVFSGAFSGMTTSHLSSVFAPGMDSLGRDWNAIMAPLPDAVNALDVSSADLTGSDEVRALSYGPLVQEAAALFTNKSLREEFLHDAPILLNATLQIWLVVGDTLFQCSNVFVTGHVLTTILNCLFYEFRDYVQWAVYRRRRALPSDPVSYRNLIVGPRYSDDKFKANLANDGWNNLEELELARLLFGVKLTSSTKSSIVRPSESKFEALFLKRRNVLACPEAGPDLKGCLFGALEWNSVLRPLRWSRGSTPEEHLQVFDGILVEVAMHQDPDLYLEWQQRLQAFAREAGSTWIPRSFREQMTAYKATKLVGSFLTGYGCSVQGDAPSIVEVQSEATQIVSAFKPLQRVIGIPHRELFPADAYSAQGITLPKGVQNVVQVGTYTWTPANVNNDKLFELEMPGAMINVSPQVKAWLDGYHAFRSDLELELRITSPPGITGSALWSFEPYTPVGTTRHSSTTFAQSMNNALRIDPSVPRSAIMKIGWTWHEPWVELAQTQAVKYQFGTTRLAIECPSSTSLGGTVPNVVATLYAKLVDPVVNAFSPETAVPAGRPKMPMLSGYGVSAEPEYEVIPGHGCSSDQKVVVTIDAAPQTSTGKMGETVKVDPLVKEKKEKKKKDAPTKAPPAPREESKQKAQVVSTGMMQYTPEDSFGTGVAKFFTNFFNTVGTTITNVVPYASKILGSIGPALALLDYPPEERPPRPIISIGAPNYSHTRGLFAGQVMALFPTERTTPAPGLAPDIYELIRIFGVMGRAQFTSASARLSTIVDVPLVPVRLCNWLRTPGSPNTYTYNHTFLSYFSSLYWAWQGSIAFKVVILASTGVSWSIRCLWLPGAQTALASPSTDAGDVQSKVFSGVGSDEQIIVVSGVGSKPWFNTGCLTGATTPSQAGRFVLLMEEKPVATNSAGTATINVVVEVAAGPDFQLAHWLGPGQRNLTTYSNPLFDVKSPQFANWVQQRAVVRERYARDNGTGCSGLAVDSRVTLDQNMFFPVTETNLLQLCKKPQFHSTISAQADINIFTIPSSLSLRFLTNTFRAYKAGMRFILEGNGNGRMGIRPTPSSSFVESNQSQIDAGMIVANTAIQPVVGVEFPYRSSYLFLDTWTGVNGNPLNLRVTADNFTQVIRCTQMFSDEAVLNHLVAPPQEVFTSALIDGHEYLLLHHIGGEELPVPLPLKPTKTPAKESKPDSMPPQ